MISAAPSPCLARAASRAVAGTPGATGQTLRIAGRSSPFSAPPFPGRADQFTATPPILLMAVFPVGAAISAPHGCCVDGLSSFAAGTQC